MRVMQLWILSGVASQPLFYGDD